jgi:hypothetical protein
MAIDDRSSLWRMGGKPLQSTAVMTEPTPSTVLALAEDVVARAEAIAQPAGNPAMRQALREIELIARESKFWLLELSILPDGATLASIHAGLQQQRTRLDELEGKLRASADATP